MTKEMEGACMPSADFTYYAPQQAQKILLYQEVCQIVKKTMILEKVNHFGNFPGTVVLHVYQVIKVCYNYLDIVLRS